MARTGQNGSVVEPAGLRIEARDAGLSDSFRLSRRTKLQDEEFLPEEPGRPIHEKLGLRRRHGRSDWPPGNGGPSRGPALDPEQPGPTSITRGRPGATGPRRRTAWPHGRRRKASEAVDSVRDEVADRPARSSNPLKERGFSIQKPASGRDAGGAFLRASRRVVRPHGTDTSTC